LLSLPRLLIDDDMPLARQEQHTTCLLVPTHRETNNITTWLTSLFNLCSSLSPLLAFFSPTPFFGSRGREAKQALSGAAFALTVQPFGELRCSAARF
jgi:hypothetical protein